MLRDFFEDMPVLASVLCLCILGLLFILFDGFGSKTVYYSGFIVGKDYKAEEVRTEFTYYSNPDGTTQAIPTTKVDPETWLLHVRVSNGEVLTIETPAKLFYEKKEGDSLLFYSFEGLVSKLSYGRHAER